MFKKSDIFLDKHRFSHRNDTKIGGTFDVIEQSGYEEDGYTNIEFKLNLDSHDKYDTNFKAENNIKAIWAISDEDDFTKKHSRKGSFKFKVIQ